MNYKVITLEDAIMEYALEAQVINALPEPDVQGVVLNAHKKLWKNGYRGYDLGIVLVHDGFGTRYTADPDMVYVEEPSNPNAQPTQFAAQFLASYVQDWLDNTYYTLDNALKVIRSGDFQIRLYEDRTIDILDGNDFQ